VTCARMPSSSCPISAVSVRLHNDPFARGVFFGMTSHTARADLIVAVLEAAARAFVDGLYTVLRGGGEAGAALGAARLGRLAVPREDPTPVCTPLPVAAEILPRAEIAGLLRRRRPRFTDLYLKLRGPFRDISM